MSTDVPPLPAEKAADSDAVLVERTVAGDQKAYELLVIKYQRRIQDRKSTRLNSSHIQKSRMPSSA